MATRHPSSAVQKAFSNGHSSTISRSKLTQLLGGWMIFLRGSVLLLVGIAIFFVVGIMKPLFQQQLAFDCPSVLTAEDLQQSQQGRSLAFWSQQRGSVSSSSSSSSLILASQLQQELRQQQQQGGTEALGGIIAASSDTASSTALIGSSDTAVVDGHRRLRVFVYDLPPRFNMDLVDAFSRNRNIQLANGTTRFPYPAHQHSGEWWLLQDLLRPAEEREYSPAERVLDPAVADVFFVPVFSSLSLVVNPLVLVRQAKLADDAYDDDSMQVSLIEWLEQQPAWQRSKGRDHVIPAQDPMALFTILPRLRNAMLLLSDFGRVPPGAASVHKDIILPYVHRISSYTQAEEERDRAKAGGASNGTRSTLLFFMGNRYRKDGGFVRDTLFKVLDGEAGVVLKEGLPTNEGRRATRHGMRTSQFCLHPAGDTPSACRLFDAIVSLCVPVVVSDDIELPFEDLLDYRQFAVFVPTFKAIRPGYLARLLRSPRVQQRWPAMQQKLREVRHLFEWEPTNGTVSAVWREVAARLPAMRLQMHRDRRMVLGGPSVCTCQCTHANSKRDSGSNSSDGAEGDSTTTAASLLSFRKRAKKWKKATGTSAAAPPSQ